MSSLPPGALPTALTARPWTRWWWMASAVTSAGITRHLEAYAAAGLGGVEITPIYGVRGAEDQAVRFLSDEWQAMFEHAVREGRRIGIGVDLNLGTGWPYGGPHVPDTLAPQRLRFVVMDADRAEKLTADLPPGDAVLAATALSASGDAVPWPDGDRMPADVARVVAAVVGPTRQQVKRSAPGGEGNVMCPYRREALEAYVEPFERMFALRPDVRPRAAFYDSFEVFGSDYAPGLRERFRAQHGYDVFAELPALAGVADPEDVERVRGDYRDTLFTMLLEDGIQPWCEWVHRQGFVTRYQAHGAPGNLLDLYAAADIPETETFGTHEFPFLPPVNDHPERLSSLYVLANKFASSAALLTGRRLVASETFTWHREHFAGSFAEMKPEVELLIHAGINHIVFHGSTYSPADAAWPGWLFYAATHFDLGDPLWRDLPEFTRFIAQLQTVAQRSEPEEEALVYFPFHDAISTAEGDLFRPFSVHRCADWFSNEAFRGTVEALWDQNVGFALVSDRLLEGFEAVAGGLGNGHVTARVLFVPRCRFMPPGTFEKIQRLAAAGVTVRFVEGGPESVPGMGRRAEGEARLAAAREFAPMVVIPREDVPTAAAEAGAWMCDSRDGTLRVSRFRDREERRYFVSNFAATPVTCDLPGEAAFELAPGESRLFRAGEPAPARRVPAGALTVSGGWTLRAVAGGPALPPPVRLEEPVAWTRLGDPAWEDFSGTAIYGTAVACATAVDARLEIEHLGHTARVRVNGTEAGVIWSHPFRLDLTGVLRPGDNQIEIEVTNLAANRIRAMDRDGVEWRIFHDINFADLHYRGFNAARWPVMPSGIWGRVGLTRLEPLA